MRRARRVSGRAGPGRQGQRRTARRSTTPPRRPRLPRKSPTARRLRPRTGTEGKDHPLQARGKWFERRSPENVQCATEGPRSSGPPPRHRQECPCRTGREGRPDVDASLAIRRGHPSGRGSQGVIPLPGAKKEPRRAEDFLPAGRGRSPARRSRGVATLGTKRKPRGGEALLPITRGCFLVGKGGVEPPRPFGHTDLNRARLPFRHLPLRLTPISGCLERLARIRPCLRTRIRSF